MERLVTRCVGHEVETCCIPSDNQAGSRSGRSTQDFGSPSQQATASNAAPWSWNMLPPNRQSGRLSEWTQYTRLRLSQSTSDGFKCSPMKRTAWTLINYLRAYDGVWRDALLLKMLRKGVSPHIIRLIQAWQANRQSWVTFEGAKSKKTTLKQGVT